LLSLWRRGILCGTDLILSKVATPGETPGAIRRNRTGK
jgi:hypothetical protein